MRKHKDIKAAIDRHGDTVWRVCVMHLGAGADAQDAFQESFLKYSLYEGEYSSEEHRKAWLIRVTGNTCKDMLRASSRKNIPLDEANIAQKVAANAPGEGESRINEIIEAVRALDDPPRTPLYLSLYEGYTAPEIAEMVDAPVNTVYSWIARGKQRLREVLE